MIKHFYLRDFSKSFPKMERFFKKEICSNADMNINVKNVHK